MAMQTSSPTMSAKRMFLATVLALAPVGAALAGDFVFDSTFEEAVEGPFSDAQAARFLTQTTFGPTLADIKHLRAIGYYAWLNEQYALPATLHQPYVHAIRQSGEDVYQNIRREAWWSAVLHGPDQLRQRVAFALSELLVVSDQGGGLDGYPEALAHYYDLLVQNAFGNYRDLLEQVTLSPVMGHYLSMFKNQKADPAQNIRPDENYAREIMQLFSIGLVQLNADGTPALVGGQPVPTYDQDTISGFARVFTGWSYPHCDRDPADGTIQWWEWEWCPSGPVEWPDPGWDDYEMVPMVAYASYHDSVNSKQLLIYPGEALPGGVLSAGGSAESDLQAALDNIFNHPNVGPFVVTRLIKRLVTSNPSPDYVARVVAVFDNNGLGVRGDLGATVQAILMDPQARTLPPASSNAGKLREPLLRKTQLFRVLDANAVDYGRFREWWSNYLGQQPLSSPSVFNFFLPDYSPTGPLFDLGLSAPEFQITNDTTVATVAQGLGSEIYWSWRGQDGELPEDIVMDLSDGMALANDPVRLVDHYDLLLMNRTMSDFMFNTLVNHVTNTTHWDGSVDQDALRTRVQDTVWLIFTSPEYVIER